MKKIFTLLLVLTSLSVFSQPFNNEWIRYNQTYYKFKIGKNGLYRIPKTVLDAAGIGNTSVEYFELWRNGELVPFYPSVPNGPLPSDGYIEFWGKINDGKPDRPLYRDPLYQHTTAVSLFADSATYFLSVNTNQSGFLIWDATNDVSGNTLPLEPYFMYTAGNYFKYYLNPGFAAVVGEYVYSSSYDKGEFWSIGIIRPGTPIGASSNNLFPYTGGPGSVINFGAVGAALNPRTVNVKINGTTVKDTIMDYFNDVNTSVPFSTSLLSSGNAAVSFSNNSAVSSDRMVASYYEITYPRLFNFGGQKNFEFKLPPNGNGYYIEITNFNFGTVAPVLYDLTFGSRYVGDISTPGLIKFVLPASTSESNYILVNEESANITTINNLTTRNFIPFSDPANQGNYLIITSPVLYAGTSGNNPVLDYKAYRESPEGGSFRVKVMEVDELTDQFAFGIRLHPLAIRNFISYARLKYSLPVKNVFLIGRGMDYIDQRAYESDTLVYRLNLVPTFGYPASDNLLAAADIRTSVPAVPIGRLSAVFGHEVEDYLEKVKEYESIQKNAPNTIAGRNWMKNVVHVTGSSDPYLGTVLCNYMHIYKQMIEDTLFGGDVYTFCKTTTNPVEQLNNEKIKSLFEEGISVLTYFGHSSSTTLEFNIDNPQAYNNQGKYPVFYVNGCNAGNFFTYYPQRLLVNETLSEKFTLAKQRGSIAFIASTHYGIVNYLNLYLTNLYNSMGKTEYGKTLGEINEVTLQGLLNATGPFDYYARMHAEEITLHGDPALRLNVQPKPDYVIEEQLIKIDPTFISIAENNFHLKVKVVNIGKATGDSVTLEVKRQLPDGSTLVIYRSKIRGIRYADSLVLDVPIVATRDKGLNRIIATIDPDNLIDEMAENNNTATKDFFIFEDEARPVFPYDYAIVNDPGQKLYFSTANPFSLLKDYIVEVDTTEKFDSPQKISKTISTVGGLIEYIPGISYTDSTVYYWRVSSVPSQGNDYRWNGASFVYISGAEEGFNQSHFYQHEKSASDRVYLDSVSRKWKYENRLNSLFIRIGTWVSSATQETEVSVTVNDSLVSYNTCAFSSLVFNVIDPVTMRMWINTTNTSTGQGLYGSWRNDCFSGRKYNFEFRYTDTAWRRKIINFMDNVIPTGYYVLVRSFLLDSTVFAGFPQAFVSDWKADTAYFGSNNSVYHRMLQQGFMDVDSFYRPRQFTFFYKKDQQSEFAPQYLFTDGTYDKNTMIVTAPSPDTLGYTKSPVFGPAKSWKTVIWQGYSEENPTPDNPSVQVIGVDRNNVETVLYTLDRNTRNFDVSTVDPVQYPYMRLQLRNVDSLKQTPFQLRYWRIYYVPVPEGAIAPNLYFKSKDTLDIGEKLQFAIAFKNISKAAFDSLKVKLTILDKNNVQHVISLPRKRPIISGDSVIVNFELDTKDYPENNILFLDINSDNDQPEQYHFNNFVYRNFYVKPDLTNPLLDVTFDGVHILNRDIVSAKPHILIKLKDESKFMLLNDTTLSSVQVRYPDGSLRTYRFDNDTLRFTPATTGADNTASIDFTPAFLSQLSADGDEYELIVKGKDRSGNQAGSLEYRVTFRVISKPMISNLLNYPNPFSTSTAFVFTITGYEIPQNIKIQILTVTGKIVREITKDELGPLHIGRNITEFRWDGTDQYGQRLANGVYLYRVVTTLNGKSMDKYKADGDNTDKYFNNGYGKMYLMR